MSVSSIVSCDPLNIAAEEHFCQLAEFRVEGGRATFDVLDDALLVVLSSMLYLFPNDPNRSAYKIALFYAIIPQGFERQYRK
jgi:hypothetical protein